MNFGYGTPAYGTYWYTALACKGNFVVAAADVTTLPGHQPYGFYLGFLISSDGGQSWRSSTGGLPAPTWAHRPMPRKVEIIDSLHVVAFGDSSLLVRTTNGGATWQQLTAPSMSRIGDISFSDTSHGVMVVWDAIQSTYVTSDGGMRWTATPFTRPAAVQCHDYGNGTYRFFSLLDGRVYTARNNWSSLDSTEPIIRDSTARHYVFARCSFGESDTIFAYGYRDYLAVRQGIRPFIARSTNGGREWDHVYDADTSNYWDLGSAEYMSDVSRDTIVAGLKSGANQVLMSTDRGATWQFDTILMRDSVNDLAADSYGVGVNATGGLIAANSWDGADGAFLLLGSRSVAGVPAHRTVTGQIEVFPSPAQNSVTLAGELDRGFVRILDVLGREVLRAEVPSRGDATLDISKLPSGVYFLVNGESSIKFVKR